MARVVIPGFRKIEVSGGEYGTTNYEDLTNKPFINNVPLVGNLNTADLKLTDATLTEEGVPAEAKTVGAKIEEHSTSLTTLKKETTVNLLKPTLETTTLNGVTCTNNGDGTFTLDTNGGESTDATYFVVTDSGSGSRLSIQKYKLVGCHNGSTSTFNLEFYNVDKWGLDIGDGLIIDQKVERGYRIRICIQAGVTLDNVIFKPMITTNLNATYDDFVPCTGDTGKLNSDVASLLKRIEALESLTNKTDTAIVESE